ncbi:hypothetical protein LCGC14_0372020 [marine sediment metagenome]|uniref:Uncharacterized protein n=1 Tax=marine sediment metagenome TaxID=412755 RepID=A0A0F9T575_9ZZZZ
MIENECKAGNEKDCKNNREEKKCVITCGCGRLFALKLRKLIGIENKFTLAATGQN